MTNDEIEQRAKLLKEINDPTGLCATPWVAEQTSMMCPPIILDKHRDVVATDVNPECVDFIATAPAWEAKAIERIKELEAKVKELEVKLHGTVKVHLHIPTGSS